MKAWKLEVGEECGRMEDNLGELALGLPARLQETCFSELVIPAVVGHTPASMPLHHTVLKARALPDLDS